MRYLILLVAGVTCSACGGTTEIASVQLDAFVHVHAGWSYHPNRGEFWVPGDVEFHLSAIPPALVDWKLDIYKNGPLETSLSGTVRPGERTASACEDRLPSCVAAYFWDDGNDRFFMRFTATSPGNPPLNLEWYSDDTCDSPTDCGRASNIGGRP